MKIRSVILLSAFILSGSTGFAGEKGKFNLQFEFGNNNVRTSLNEKWQIRQDVGTSDYASSGSSVFSSMSIAQFGVRPELSFFDGKFAISSGLRYNLVQSDLSSSGVSSLPSFFYLRYAGSGLNTEYARVFGVKETTHYLAIPFALKFTPLSVQKFDLYLKTGIDAGLKLAGNTNIDFVNDNMEGYEAEILGNLGASTNKIFSTWNNAIGATYGAKDKFRYSLEILLPSFFITGRNSSLVNADIYSGFRILVQLPGK